MRVVTLLPSATEIVYALGIEPVGVSHECDHPPGASDLPTVVHSRVDPDASSAEIDEQVAAAEQSGGVYELDRELLAELDPDLVVSQGICEVCAVDEVLVEEAVEDLGLDCEVLTTDPHHLEDVFGDVLRIGSATDREERAARPAGGRANGPEAREQGAPPNERAANGVSHEQRAAEVVASLRERVDRVAETAAGIPDDERPRVAVLDWLDPVMVAGHWIPGLVETAGGRYGLAAPGDRSEPREWDEIRAYDPEVLVAAPCGFGLEQTAANAAGLTDRPGYADLAAVREGRAYAMDGHHYVNRPGPRLVDTLEFLAGVLHPDRFEAPPDDVVRSLVTRRA
jgi:iron complex transport system substrate-binding protein